jgi:MFS family permease
MPLNFSSNEPLGATHARRAWTQVALAFLFMLINFADKSVVGLSSVPIMREMSLSNTQFGTLGSAFFLLFSISGVTVGFAANRVRTKTLMMVMAIVWALGLLPMSIASSFSLLLCSRVILGAAEGPAFPITLHTVYKWFPDRQRALPTSVVACGAAFGTGVVAPFITWVIVRYGWHSAFGMLGVASLVWACLWWLFAAEGPIDAFQSRSGLVERLPYRQLLSSRTAIGVFVAGFGAYWVTAVNITWLVTYLIKDVHVTPARAAWIVGLPSVMQMILAPSFAWLSQALTRSGVSSRVARGVLGTSCVITSGVSIMCMTALNLGILKVFLIGLGFSIGNVIFTLGSALIGEISPPSQRGAMLGITNSIHTLAGLGAPFVMGRIIDAGVDSASGFRSGYLFAGALVVAMGALGAVLIHPEADLQRFGRQRHSAATGGFRQAR